MAAPFDADLGTPARKGATQVDLEIDGITVRAPEGTSVIRAAALAGVNVPKLCATDKLEPFGSCRLCLVEIEGFISLCLERLAIEYIKESILCSKS